MSDYRKEFRRAQSDTFWTMPRVFLMLFAFVILFGVGGWVFSLLSQPARIVSKTFDADNVITSYEYYRDAYGNFQARTAQVTQFKKLMATADVDQQEKNRLRIEVAAIQQSCRDLAQKYNANANKVNKSIFMGTSVPANLNAGECE
jgi:hypothetical protein